MIGISSCLAGIKCTYRGSDNLVAALQRLVLDNRAILICPEVLGGLSIPRYPCEIIDGKVINNQGEDKTEEYLLGARRALKILQDNHVSVVVLKSKSPSCGKDYIYDGNFSHNLIEGDGIACQMFKRAGIKVFSENELEDFFRYINEIDESKL